MVHIFAIPALVIVALFALAISFVAAIFAPRRTCTRRRCGNWPLYCNRCGPRATFA